MAIYYQNQFRNYYFGSTGSLGAMYYGALEVNPGQTTGGGGGGDADATAYLAAVVAAGGTVDATITSATNTLFTSLKSNSLYTKLKAFYPILGGVANSAAINGNLNTSFNLSFFNTWTHNSNGSQPTNGASYATTNYIPSTEHPSNTMSFGYFENSSGTGVGDNYSMGIFQGQDRFLSCDYATGNIYRSKYLQNSSTTSITIGTLSEMYGFVQMGSDGTTKYLNLNKNGVETLVSGARDGTTTLPSLQMYLGNLNLLGSPYNNHGGRLCFAYMGDFLSTSEMTTLASIVNTFQSTLGRNTY